MNDNFRTSPVASLEDPCPDCGEHHDDAGFDGFVPPDAPAFEAAEPRWSKGIDAMLDQAFDEVSNVVEETEAEPVAACFFAVHEDGSVTIVSGGFGAQSDSKLACALACDAVRKALAQQAAEAKSKELLNFALGLAQATR